MGGMSGEYEVSLVSAASVINGLDKKKYDVVEIKISKEGKWPENFTISDLENKKVDIIFPVIHGTYGEDGKLQGLLEMFNIPYVGAGVLGSAAAMDKIVAKQIFQSIGLNTPKYHYFLNKDYEKYSNEWEYKDLFKMCIRYNRSEYPLWWQWSL